MIPLHDENPSGIRPLVTYSLIALNIAVFAFQFLFIGGKGEEFYLTYGFVPMFFKRDPAGKLYSVFTSMFLHGGFFHVAGNMLYLYIFGDNIEAAYSKIKYAVFYFVCGALAAMVHYLFNSLSNVPAIGASGAISGILGSYLVLYPNSKITSLVYIGWGYYFTSISAKWFILFWFVYQVFLVFIGEQSGVAYWAHIGGFFTGLIVTVVLKDKLLRRRYMFPYF